jgi:phage portal protein BeeE
MLFALDRVTHSNGEQLGHEFVTMALTSWLERWQGEIDLKMLTPDERGTHYAEFLTDDLVRADLATRTEAQIKQIAARMLSPNEARAQNNMDAYTGGDSYENPNTTSATPATAAVQQ